MRDLFSTFMNIIIIHIQFVEFTRSCAITSDRMVASSDPNMIQVSDLCHIITAFLLKKNELIKMP